MACIAFGACLAPQFLTRVLAMKSKRKTAQKKAIELVFVDSNQPLTPQEALGQAQTTSPSLGIATVYRFLKEALDSGRIQRVEIPGQPPRYEMVRETNHHHSTAARVGRCHGASCSGDCGADEVAGGLSGAGADDFPFGHLQPVRRHGTGFGPGFLTQDL
ncbi:MAG: hypothetical protein HC897_10410 [Thermoanaerobaculia bacterium]|nr:hypothetical protein [Thermoanaerobaculia bacterium]